MKNYLPLYVIIILLVGIFVFNYTEINAVENRLLEPAVHMRDKISQGEDVTDEFKNLSHTFKEHEVRLNILINHAVYNDVMRCMVEMDNDIEHNRIVELKADTDRLIFFLKDIIDNEKPKINNIF